MTGFGSWLEGLEILAPYQPKGKAAEMAMRAENRIDMVRRVAQAHNMPNPTTYLASGSHADVFNTDRPNVVVRIGTVEASDCEKVLDDPRVQASGGVVKVLGSYETTSPRGRAYLVSYKEKVDTQGWQHLVPDVDITRLHDVDPQLETDYGDTMTAEKLLTNVNFEFYVLGHKMTVQSVADFFRGLGPVMGNLAKAIDAGVPLKDLHSGNVGLNSKGKLVVFDC